MTEQHIFLAAIFLSLVVVLIPWQVSNHISKRLIQQETEHLDQWGATWGVSRFLDEPNDSYRHRILVYILWGSNPPDYTKRIS